MKRLVEIEPFDLGLLHYDATAKVWKEVDSTSAVKITNKSFKLGDKIYVDVNVFVKAGNVLSPENFFPNYKIGKNIVGNFAKPLNIENYNLKCDAWNSTTPSVIPVSYTTTDCECKYITYVDDTQRGKPGYVSIYLAFNPLSNYQNNYNFYRFTGWLPADILEKVEVYKYYTNISESMGGNWVNGSQEISELENIKRYSNTNLYKVATGKWIGDYVLGPDELPEDYGVSISKTFADGTMTSVAGTYNTQLKRFELVIPDNFYDADNTHGEVVAISFGTY